MPFNNDKQYVDEDQQSDSGSLRFSESMASLSDYEQSSRQSFTSDSSSKSSSPASTSPPRVITFDEVMATAKNLTNLSLAHEIAVNENFRLEEDAIPENSLAGQMRRIVHQAFWDVLKAELSAEPPEYEHAIRLFEEIRESLLSFLTPGGRSQLYSQICEVLDIDLLRQQAEHSAVDIQGLANYVISTMGKMCAPVRDQVIRDLKATDDIVELLRQIFHVLDLMKMDQVNFAIRNIRPHIQRQLVEYERSKFQEILEETPDALRQTTEWLKESIDEELLNPETAISPGAEASSPPRLSPMLILHKSFLKLLQWDYQKEGLPETLITDEIRLQELTEKLNQLKIIACLSLITNNMVGAITEGLPELANRLKRISAVLLEGMNKVTFNLKEALNSIGVQTCVEINKALKERGLPALNAEVQANLVGQFSSIEEKDNPVRSLIDKRIQLYMKSLLCLPSPQKSMPPVPGGLDVIQQELEVLGCQYANIVTLNKQIYGSFYASIFRKLLFGDEGLGKVDASLPAK